MGRLKGVLLAVHINPSQIMQSTMSIPVQVQNTITATFKSVHFFSLSLSLSPSSVKFSIHLNIKEKTTHPTCQAFFPSLHQPQPDV